MSQPAKPYDEELADLLHELLCEAGQIMLCPRYRPGTPHHGYYLPKARLIIAKLEPLIGVANVHPAVRIILEETA